MVVQHTRFLFCFGDKVSLCSFGWPYRDISASTSQVLRLNLCTTIPGSVLAFNPSTQETDFFSPWTDWSTTEFQDA